MEGTDLLTEMEAYVTDGAKAAAEADAENPLPFESIGDYSTEPADFGEMAQKMMDIVETVFDLAAVYNRRSPEYLKSCSQLEKGIRYLGSCCLTKAALETKEYSFPELGQLSTDKLYRMASFHFRKIDRALHEFIDEKHAVDDDLLEMEYRYFHLMQRLRSTEVKIYTYDFKRCFEKEEYAPVVKGLAFSKDTWNRGRAKRSAEAPAFHRAPAFPLRALQDAEKQCPAVSGRGEEECGIETCDARRDQGTETVPLRGDHADDKAAEHTSDDGGQLPDGGDRLSTGNDRLPAPGHRGSTGDRQLSMIDLRQQSEEEAEEELRGAIGQIRSDPEAPKFMTVLSDVFERSAKSGEGGLQFTLEEVAFLSSDPEFIEFDPEMAERLNGEIRNQI